MDDLKELFAKNRPTTLTFDCYGTLVDWEGGAAKALRNIYGFAEQLVSDDVLIDLFLELDALVIREGIFPYSAVLQIVADRIAEKLLGSPTPELSKAFPQSLPSWPVFAETNEALTQLSQHFRLAIISNVDDDLIAGTLTQISAPFDEVITSQQTSTYKPDRPIFEAALRKLDEEPGRIVHIAEGLGEARPATALGMKSVWVKRSKRSDDGSKAIPNANAPSLMAIVEAAQSSLVAPHQIKAGK
ncbi:HAD-IA family hydrolase [Roseibium polysiphoniae]|uniref:HAD-IA family hydrolase n=1 Tax=Roseibium polysiphoniae TaxID=2571221 RepID=A0ABR9C853_9HYPH|nr:HAD-IA family hydrolase [Roseibium polysiphoniae]MBD8875091.1 HAD-IA family hydrolase [Roseibium polysiphoniae]